MYEKPFDKSFLDAVESFEPDQKVSCWYGLFNSTDKTMNHVRKAGFTDEYIEEIRNKLLNMTTDQIVTFGLAYDNYYNISLYLLQDRNNRETFEKAKALHSSIDADERNLAASIIFGRSGYAFREETCDLVKQWIEVEKDSVVVEALVCCIHKYSIENCTSHLLALKNHKSWEVRKAVALALTEKSSDSLNGLIHLTHDENENVRDWATFSLQQLIWLYLEDDELEDARAAAEAFYERLSDSFEEVRYEAIVGLAMFNDTRVLEHIKKGLKEPPVRTRILDAAIYYVDISLMPLIEDLKEDDVASLAALDLLEEVREKYNELATSQK